jgi:hypothetical protein
MIKNQTTYVIYSRKDDSSVWFELSESETLEIAQDEIGLLRRTPYNREFMLVKRTEETLDL